MTGNDLSDYAAIELGCGCLFVVLASVGLGVVIGAAVMVGCR